MRKFQLLFKQMRRRGPQLLVSLASPSRFCVASLLAVLVAIPAFRAFLSGLQEPSYHGQPWTAWLSQFDHYPLGLSVSESQSHAPEAVQAVLQVGTNALPRLLVMLSNKDSQLNSSLMRFAAQQSVIELPFTPDSLVQRRAAAAFEVLGTRAQPAVPQLINLLHDRRTVALSAVALAATGSQAVLPLSRALANSDPQIRAGAAYALGLVFPQQDVAVTALVQALGDPDAIVRRSAALALGRQMAYPNRAVPALAQALEDQNESVVIVVLRSLRQFGTQAKSALPALLLQRRELKGRSKCELEETLKMIDPSTASNLLPFQRTNSSGHHHQVKLMDKKSIA